jgi:hypothetical protein
MRILLIGILILVVAGAALADVNSTLNIPTKSGSIDQWGVWVTPDNGTTWLRENPVGTQVQNNIALTANVEIWERDTLDANTVNFHFGRTSIDGVAQPISVVLKGLIQSNNDETVDIWAADGTSLKLLKANSGQFGDLGADIPCKWYYGLTEATATTECTYDSGDQKAVAFPTGFGTMALNQTFCIKVTATPNAYQADGSYVLDPTISCTPCL